MDQGTVSAAVDAGNPWLAVEIRRAPIPVDLCLGQDVVDMEVDSIDEDKDVVIITADLDSVTEVSDTTEFLGNPDVYRKLKAVVG